MTTACARASSGPFANSVISRYELDGRTKYDGLSVQLERRFSGFWSARASYTLGHARGNNSGAPAAVNNYQLLAEKNLDLGEGPRRTFAARPTRDLHAAGRE